MNWPKAGSSILLDANLLVLDCVGRTGLGNISRHKRLNAFDDRDFLLLHQILATARSIVTLPNIATEASNLIRQTANPLRMAASEALRLLLSGRMERYVESKNAVADIGYLGLGLTDAAILHELSPDSETCILTVDFRLYAEALGRGIESFNFNHFKDERGDLQ